MDAGTLSIRKVFGQERRYVVPLFQRPYVWKREEQWQPLWDDVRTVADRLVNGDRVRPHFLGAIVLDQQPKPTGHLETRLVIDGQQRLTTIQLLVEAFYDICGTAGADKHHRALEKLTRNDDPLSEDEDEQFKVWPTNVDQEIFRRVMRSGSPAEVRAAFDTQAAKVGHPLADGYLFFHEALEEWLAPTTEGFQARLEALYETVRDHVRLVVIDLDVEDDAQVIFETLNARGTPLLPADLVKNLLFHRALGEGRDLAKLYASNWKAFDEEHGYWRIEVGRGRMKRARIDGFLHDYLTLRLRDDVSVGRLFAAFQDHLLEEPAVDAGEHLARLRRHGDIFKSFDEFDAGSREAVFFDRLRSMQTSTANPFLLALFGREDLRRVDLLTVLADVESFLVRRMVCRLTTKNYNKLFIEMIAALDGPAAGLTGRVRAQLLKGEGDSLRWPRDEEFARAWREESLGWHLASSRVRLILEALEQRMRTGKSEALSFDETLTIEHLLPQSWHAHWPLPGGADAEKAGAKRDATLQRMGNLTLVTQKLNPALSNGPWTEKRQEILKHSALALNRQFQDTAVWDEATIERRGELLLDAAFGAWPLHEVAT